MGHNYRQVAKWLTRERIPAQRAGQWKAQSVKKPNGALLAFDRRAHPHALQEVSDASAPPQTGFKRAHLGRLVCDVTPVLLSTSAR